MHEEITCPRLIISALRGGAGKSTVAIGITAASRNLGKNTASFKKGPDYIDAGWLSLAAGTPCHNLDTFFMSPATVLASFSTHARTADLAVIEGNRGLYDGIDIDGATSTAEIAKLLGAPVILCLDCTKTTRTSAAVVSGCIAFDPDVTIGGVVLNRVAGQRHESILRRSIEHYCQIPVIGAIPKLTAEDFPERHMGLVPTAEHAWAREAVASAAALAAAHIDLADIQHIAEAAPRVCLPSPDKQSIPLDDGPGEPPLIAVIRDAAFQFYYEENLEALVTAGAKIQFVSPLTDAKLPPETDALYIGGGFPETHAAELAANESFRRQLAELVEAGLPVYAECGGLIYLGEELVVDHAHYPMCRIFPARFGISPRPVGHGYTISRVDRENPYFAVGTELKGHEFRYSRVLAWEGKDQDLVFSTERGKGFVRQRDGLCYRNVLAGYTHIHALGTPVWAEALVRRARIFQAQKKAG